MRTLFYLFGVISPLLLFAGCRSSSGDSKVSDQYTDSSNRLNVYASEAVKVSESQLRFPEGIRHVVVEPCNGKYHFLHDAAITEHKAELIAAWYNCPEEEISDESCIRSRRSSDHGITWSDVEVIAEDKEKKGIYYAPVQLLSFQDNLYAFVGKMTAHDRIINTTTYRYNQQKKTWQELEMTGALFLPDWSPVKVENGNWIMAGRVAASLGELPLIPAVLISSGDYLEKRWRLVKLQKEEFKGEQYPETTIIPNGKMIYAFTRVNGPENKPDIFISNDYGESWDKVVAHNFRSVSSKLYSGKLHDGRGYVLFNYPVSGLTETGFEARTVLAIAVSKDAANPFSFSSIYKIQSPGPNRPHLSHYPSAHEYDGNLYVVYTANFPNEVKRQCELAIVPIKSLR